MYEGQYDGKKGKWIQDIKSSFDTYIFLDDLEDVEAYVEFTENENKEKARKEALNKWLKASPYLIGCLIYLIILAWVSFKINGGYSGPSSTILRSTGQRDSSGRDTYTVEQGGDFGGCLNMILIIGSVCLFLYLGAITERRVGDFEGYIVFMTALVSFFVVIIFAALGRLSN